METIKVKVIDLYNKIANSKDEDYKKIKFIFNDYTYTWNEYKCDYDSENTAHLKTGILGYLSIDKDQLNREIEIIEDTSKEDKKIEKLESLNTDYHMERKKYGSLTNEEIVLDIQTLKNYINKLVDKVNGE